MLGMKGLNFTRTEVHMKDGGIQAQQCMTLYFISQTPFLSQHCLVLVLQYYLW